MTHYKMNSLHLGCGESLSTLYRRSESLKAQRQNRVAKTVTSKKAKSPRQTR
ncbi:MAG: hypothetical protein KAT25_04695 [Sulfuriflexus sp.]|nr:hypothetical protein [Sulfuriflexus sp.]